MLDFIKRMQSELEDLSGKLKRAEKALQGSLLDEKEKQLLSEQVEGMKLYKARLQARFDYDCNKHGR